MKRILAVLVLLALCGMAFSVTGKIFTTIRSTDNTGSTVSSFGDTGFVLNFDGFDLKYVMKAPKTITSGGMTIGSATSPGLFGIENIKAGDMVNVGVDVIWYTLGSSAANNFTNALGATTNSTNASYNEVEFDPLLTITLSDTLKLDINDHQAIKFYGGSVSAINPIAGTTNSATIGGNVFKIPLRVTYTGIENVSIAAEVYDDIEGDSQVATTTTTTNNITVSIFNIGFWVNAFYTVIPDTFKVGAQLQVESQSKTTTSNSYNAGALTNVTTATSLPVTILVEAVYNPASKVTLRLGGGYVIPMGDTVTVIANNSQSTNVYSTGAYLKNWDPMVEFGGGYDVTENFNIGIEGRMYFQPNASSLTGTKGTIGSSQAGGIINFQNGQKDDPAAAEVNFTYKF